MPGGAMSKKTKKKCSRPGCGKDAAPPGQNFACPASRRMRRLQTRDERHSVVAESLATAATAKEHLATAATAKEHQATEAIAKEHLATEATAAPKAPLATEATAAPKESSGTEATPRLGAMSFIYRRLVWRLS